MSSAAPTTLVVPAAALAGEEWVVTNDAFHHLVRVKRLTEGDALRLVDGRGRARAATLGGIGKREARAILGAKLPANEPRLELTLEVAPPKPERAAWLVEKATELGVVAVRFLATERAARAFTPSQLERLRRVAVAAVEQCGRALVPEVENAGSFADALAGAAEAAMPRIVLDAGGADPFSGAVFAAACASSWRRGALLVGPEGGWSEAERQALARAAVERWSLGPRTLRVETAAVVAAGILLSRS